MEAAHQLQGMKLTRDELLLKLGAARQQSPSAWRLVEIEIPKRMSPSILLAQRQAAQVRQREGRYLLRTNLTGGEPREMWEFYIQLVQVEEAFKNLKGDLSLRPIYHQEEHGSKRTSSWPSWPMLCT